MNISAINEESLLIRFSEDISESVHHQVKYYNDALENTFGVLSLVPSYNSLMVYFNLREVDYFELLNRIEKIKKPSTAKETKKYSVKIPVCYELGLDLDRVSLHTGLSVKDVIKKHTSVDYLVYMIGFTPGFPYLGGMDLSLETPRLDSPRTRIEAGSVGIGGKQTGIYPLQTPGGWNIIGKTPLKLFNSETSETLLKMGQYIRFYAITEAEYHRINSDTSYEIEVVEC